MEAADVVGQVLSLDTPDQWLLSADPGNVGGQEQWWERSSTGRETCTRSGHDAGDVRRVPRRGLVLAHRSSIPANPHADGRYILRFWSVDYYIEVWVNGRAVGHHECVDSMVEFDITPAVRPDAENLVAVRIVNPSNTPIDGMVIRECPGRNRIDPWSPGACYNNGGLIDSRGAADRSGRADRIAVCHARLPTRGDRGRGECPERDGPARDRRPRPECRAVGGWRNPGSHDDATIRLRRVTRW